MNITSNINYDISSLHGSMICFAFSTLTDEAYDEWLKALKEAAADPEVKITILTGRGKFYTAGQHLGPPQTPIVDPLAHLQHRSKVNLEIGNTMIQFPKLLIAAINGPVVGYGCTSMALCDLVYAVP